MAAATATTQPPSPPATSASIDSCIDGEFDGYAPDTVFLLCNGQVWVQTSGESEYQYADGPRALIVASRGGYQLLVAGMSQTVTVVQATHVAKTCIDGVFEGWRGDTIIPLCNGQVWQQATYTYEYHYAYRPQVLIYNLWGYHAMVEGMSAPILVRRVK